MKAFEEEVKNIMGDNAIDLIVSKLKSLSEKIVEILTKQVNINNYKGFNISRYQRLYECDLIWIIQYKNILILKEGQSTQDMKENFEARGVHFFDLIEICQNAEMAIKELEKDIENKIEYVKTI